MDQLRRWLRSRGIGSHGPGARCRVEPTTEPGAVVVIVRVTGTVVVDEVNVTVEGLKLQLLSDRRLEHIDGKSMAEPVNRGATDWNYVVYIVGAPPIEVGFAGNIEARIEAVSCKQRDIGNIAFAIIGHANSRLP